MSCLFCDGDATKNKKQVFLMVKEIDNEERIFTLIKKAEFSLTICGDCLNDEYKLRKFHRKVIEKTLKEV